MMQESGVPEIMWGEAVATSVFMHNRIINKQSPEITAYKQVFKKKPYLGHVKKLLCSAFSQIPRQRRSGWAPKSRKMILVGYDSYSNKYRLYDAEYGSIVVAKNVHFEESNQTNIVLTLPNQEDEDAPMEPVQEIKREDEDTEEEEFEEVFEEANRVKWKIRNLLT